MKQSPRTAGLDALDRERAASLANEGGSAGASVEAEPGAERSLPARERPVRLAFLGLAAMVALAAGAARRLR